MMKQLFLTKYPVFIFGILILLCSFINPDKITTLKKPGAKANALLAQDSGKLNILWAPATDFKKLTGKTIFNFSFSLNDSITLHGWHTKGVYRHTYGGTTNVRLFATNIDTIISDK